MQALISWAYLLSYLSERINLFFIYFVFHLVFEKDIEKFEYKIDEEGEKTHILVKTACL